MLVLWFEGVGLDCAFFRLRVGELEVSWSESEVERSLLSLSLLSSTLEHFDFLDVDDAVFGNSRFGTSSSELFSESEESRSAWVALVGDFCGDLALTGDLMASSLLRRLLSTSESTLESSSSVLSKRFLTPVCRRIDCSSVSSFSESSSLLSWSDVLDGVDAASCDVGLSSSSALLSSSSLSASLVVTGVSGSTTCCCSSSGLGVSSLSSFGSSFSSSLVSFSAVFIVLVDDDECCSRWLT